MDENLGFLFFCLADLNAGRVFSFHIRYKQLLAEHFVFDFANQPAMSHRQLKDESKRPLNLEGYFPVKKTETIARQKLKISRNLLKDIENDFDEFDDFLNADKAPTTVKQIDDKYINSLSSLDQMALKFKQNKHNYKDVLDDYENL